MELLFELNLGYVSCDICGEGYNYVAVWHDPWAEADTPYRVVRTSHCYGNIDKIKQSRQDVIDFLESNVFLLATRRARPVYMKFLRDVKRGTLKPPTPQPEVYYAPDLTPDYVDEYEDNGARIGCNCDACEASRGNLPVRQSNTSAYVNATNSINWLYVTNVVNNTIEGLAV